MITIEDTVEYHLPRLTQVSVQPVQGLGFAEALRATLRQDPDVIPVSYTHLTLPTILRV